MCTVADTCVCAYLLWTIFGSCDLDLDPMTSYSNLICIAWSTGGANMNFVRQGCQKLSFDKQTNIHTDRQTESIKIIKYTASQVLKNTDKCLSRFHLREFYILHCYALQTEKQSQKLADSFSRTSRLLGSQLPADGFVQRQ